MRANREKREAVSLIPSAILEECQRDRAVGHVVAGDRGHVVACQRAVFAESSGRRSGGGGGVVRSRANRERERNEWWCVSLRRTERERERRKMTGSHRKRERGGGES